MALVLNVNKLVVGEKQVEADPASIRINAQESGIEISWIDSENKKEQTLSILTNDLSGLDLEYRPFSQDCSLVIEFRKKSSATVKNHEHSFYFVNAYFASKHIGIVEDIILKLGKKDLAKKRLPRFLCNRPFNRIYVPTVRETVQVCLDIIFITTTISIILQMCARLPVMDLIERAWDTSFHSMQSFLLRNLIYYYSTHPFLTVIFGIASFLIGWPLLPLVAVVFLIQYSFLLFTIVSAYRYANSLYRNAKTYWGLVMTGVRFVQAAVFKKKKDD